MNEKILLEKFVSYAKGYGFECIGYLWNEKEDLMEKLKNLNSIEILVLEIEKPIIEIKKIIKFIRKKFKDCKVLVLLSEFNDTIEEFIIEYAIDSYLTFPVLPSQFIRGLFLLKKF